MPRTLLMALLAAGSTAPAQPVDGASVFSKRCAGCHGEDGKANTRNGKKYEIADFTAPGWSKDWTLAKIEKNARDGVSGKMPSFDDKLTAAEIEVAAKRVLELARGSAKGPELPKAP